MNKFQYYKEIRQELGLDYDRELQDVRGLLEQGVTTIAGAHVALQFSTPNSLVGQGEAHKIFAEEIEESLRLVLERYERNLRNEIAGLGLALPKAQRPSGHATPQEHLTLMSDQDFETDLPQSEQSRG